MVAETKASIPFPLPNVTELCVAFVDVVGFSEKMHTDEGRTYWEWSHLRDDILLPALSHFSGNLVKSTGDGILATFPDGVNGVLWSDHVQRRARQARAGLAMRIALNQCRVIKDGMDLAGDGVNIAARLQEYAAPGGIILTEAVQSQITERVGLSLRPIGRVALRKLSSEVTAYELLSDGRPTSAALRVEAHLPSIAVLPFQNLRHDAADDHLAAGIVEDIIVSLSSLHQLIVISRSSTIAIAQTAVDPQTIGRILGVRYLLTGTLLRNGGSLRVSMQLIDAETGMVVFGDRWFFAETDMFRIQDEIVETTIARILPNLQAAERQRALRKRPESFTAYDLTLRALDLIGSLQRADFFRAREFLELAIGQDPSFAMAYAWLARWHILNVGQGWSTEPEADAGQASEWARRAISLDPQNALALATFGHVQSYLFGNFQAAIGHLERATTASPNSAIAWLLYSATLSYVSRDDEACLAAQRALRLSPFDQHLYNFFSFLGLAHYGCEDYRAAVHWSWRALAENPRYTSSLRVLAASLAALESFDEARAAGARLLEVEPSFSLCEYTQRRPRYLDPGKSELFIERLRRAGIH